MATTATIIQAATREEATAAGIRKLQGRLVGVVATRTTKDITTKAERGDIARDPSIQRWSVEAEYDLMASAAAQGDLDDHDAGEHFDGPVMTCPPCMLEWADLTGKPVGVA
jgi:hypothetical protein